MFGRMRASPSSSSPLESLERPPPKIFKNDSLSIYESTLMKLKLGSRRRDLTPLSAEAMEAESDGGASSVSNSTSTRVERDCLPMDTDSSFAFFSDCESAGESKQQQQQRSRNASVLHLFSKYRKSPHGSNLSFGGGSASSSSSSSNCQSCGSTREQSEHECLSSSTSVCQI